MNNEERKIIGYNQQTGEPIYEQININNRISNNNGNMNPTNPVTSQFQTGGNQEINNVNSIPNNNQTNNQSNNFNSMGNTIPSQFMNQQSVQPNYNNQQFVQPQMNQTPQQSQMQNQGYHQPYYQNNNANNFGQPMNNRNKNNKKLFLIIGGVVFAVAIIIVLIVVLTKPSGNKTTNDYESDNTDINNNSSDSITYQGFEFEKLSGYEYIVENGELAIHNDKYAILPMIYEEDFDLVKASYLAGEDGIEDLISLGYVFGKSNLKKISGVEMIYYEISYDGTNAYMIFIPTTKSGYTLFVSAFARSNSFDTTLFEEAIKLRNTAKYIGGYSNYSKSFNFNLDIDALKE